MKVLITGATGFIGSYVCEYLLLKGHKVMATCRKTSDFNRCINIKGSIDWVYSDLEGWKEKIVAFKPDVIINLAWSGVEAIKRSNWSSQVFNIQMQQTYLDIAKQCGTKIFIGAGSQAEYGSFCKIIEEDEPTNPTTAYGAVKLASLDILKSFCSQNDIKWYWFRIFPCYGEGEGEEWLIPSLIKNILKGTKIELTKGEQKLAYLYIKEVAQVFVDSIESEAPCGVYNISSNKSIALKDLVIKIRDQINPNYDLHFGALPYREGQSMHMEGNNQKVCKYIYKINSDHFDEKIIQTINYYIEKYKNG